MIINNKEKPLFFFLKLTRRIISIFYGFDFFFLVKYCSRKHRTKKYKRKVFFTIKYDRFMAGMA